MEIDGKKIQPVRKYEGKKASDIINFPLNFRQKHLSISKNDELVDSPITALRIIFKILNDVSHDQFQKVKQKAKLNLFEKEFHTKENSFASFAFSIKDIDKNKNYKSIEEGLKFLEGYKKEWHKSENSKGITIKSLGGMITAPRISKGKATFLMNSFWIENMLQIPKYNRAYFEIPWILNKTKHVLFYLWLLEVPIEGTRKKFQDLQTAYGYNYKNTGDFAKNVLNIIKRKLDKNSNVSFNYSVKGTTISIVPYTPGTLDLTLDKKTITNQEITQKVNYWIQRHKLELKQGKKMKGIFKEDKFSFLLSKRAYKNLVVKNRKNKIITGNLKGIVFLEIFQKQIIEEYRLTPVSKIVSNGCPQIV